MAFLQRDHLISDYFILLFLPFFSTLFNYWYVSAVVIILFQYKCIIFQVHYVLNWNLQAVYERILYYFFGNVHSEFLLHILKKFGGTTCLKLGVWLYEKISFPLDPYLVRFFSNFLKFDHILLCYRTFKLNYSILLYQYDLFIGK